MDSKTKIVNELFRFVNSLVARLDANIDGNRWTYWKYYTPSYQRIQVWGMDETVVYHWESDSCALAPIPMPADDWYLYIDRQMLEEQIKNEYSVRYYMHEKLIESNTSFLFQKTEGGEPVTLRDIAAVICPDLPIAVFYSSRDDMMRDSYLLWIPVRSPKHPEYKNTPDEFSGLLIVPATLQRLNDWGITTKDN